MNLLILVTAMVAIVGFFTFGLVEISKVNEAGKLVSKIKETSFAFASSPSYCFSDDYILPDEIKVSGNSFYYVLRISKQSAITSSGDNINLLIFSVYPREEIRRFMTNSAYQPKAVAASSFRTKANIFIFSKDYVDSGGLTYENNWLDITNEGAFADPQAVLPANSLEFVKEIENGQANLYVVICGIGVNDCAVAKDYVGNQIHPTEGFNC